MCTASRSQHNSVECFRSCPQCYSRSQNFPLEASFHMTSLLGTYINANFDDVPHDSSLTHLILLFRLASITMMDMCLEELLEDQLLLLMLFTLMLLLSMILMLWMLIQFRLIARVISTRWPKEFMGFPLLFSKSFQSYV
ncbi:AT-hook motif nuclear-localized protein [Trifolium repens]|nr:AT-hook motif nuclear-localized protein [Trifolium repens]